ncbi:type IV pilin [Halodesulfurarchaeum sp.]|uniref:type IV pilin n=1 Tax=Halodesulfurarchaeum sp. TaxID=1980530 RepID=UPI001BC4B99F|nr:type IV pilin N-terminal domain-containing protein [Halodesulfurarchaeum sp.]
MLRKFAKTWISFRLDNRGVNSVIGVILLVAIVTILAATVGSAVFSIDPGSWVDTAQTILDMDDSIPYPN